MDISVRSYLTAGMAAVVGATAISLSPVQSAADLRAAGMPATTVAEIALTGTSIPWETIAAVVQAISSGGSLQAGVSSLIGSIGTEFVKEALPVLTAAAGDVVKFVGTTLAELLSGPDAPQIDFAAIMEAVTAAINVGNLPGAVQALTNGLSAPLTQISQVLFTPEFQAFVTGKVGSVLGALPEILRAAVQTVVGIDIKPVLDALSGLLGGLFPAASTLSTARAASASAEPAAVVSSLTVLPAPAADPDVAAVAPESDAAPAAPAEDSVAKAPAAEAAPESAPATESAPESATATEVVIATPTAEVPVELVPVEVVAPATASPVAELPTVADAVDAGPAVTRLAKPAPRGHASAAKAAESRATAGTRG